MRQFVLVFALILCGCAGYRDLMTPDPETGKSKGQEAFEAVQPFIPPPWGDLIAAAFLAQNGFLGVKKVANGRKKPEQ